MTVKSCEEFQSRKNCTLFSSREKQGFRIYGYGWESLLLLISPKIQQLVLIPWLRVQNQVARSHHPAYCATWVKQRADSLLSCCYCCCQSHWPWIAHLMACLNPLSLSLSRLNGNLTMFLERQPPEQASPLGLTFPPTFWKPLYIHTKVSKVQFSSHWQFFCPNPSNPS